MVIIVLHAIPYLVSINHFRFLWPYAHKLSLASRGHDLCEERHAMLFRVRDIVKDRNAIYVFVISCRSLHSV
jgi:hypothetical protein